MAMFEYDLQVSLYSALNNNISAPVLDHVPQNHPYPYVVIGEDNLSNWDDDTKDGMSGTINIHVWDRPEGTSGKRGKEKTKKIQAEIYSLLQRANFDIGSYGNAGITFEYSDCFMDADGITYHGTQRFRILFAEKHEFILG